MIEDREIWACANLLVQRHGAEAARVARARILALRAESSVEGARVFTQILDCIRALESRTPRGAAH